MNDANDPTGQDASASRIALLKMLPGHAAGLAVALVGGVLYAITLCRGAYPGESAYLVAEAIGAHRRIQPLTPLWYRLAGAVGNLPFGDAGTQLNALNAILAAASLWLFYNLVAGFLGDLLSENDELSPRWRRNTATASATAGTLLLALAVPFWRHATRAHPVMLGMLLLLGAANLLMRGKKPIPSWRLAMAAIPIGLLAVEFPLALPLVLPPLGAALLDDEISDIASRTAWFFAPFLLLSLGSALIVATIDAQAFRVLAAEAGEPARSLPGMLLFTTRLQIRAALQAISASPWLLLAVAVLLPWVGGLLQAPRCLTGEISPSILAMHLLVLALLWLNAALPGHMVLWPLMAHPGIAVLLCLPIAWMAAYGTAFLLITPWTAWRLRGVDAINPEPPSPTVTRLLQTCGILVALLLTAGILRGATLNARACDGRETARIRDFAHRLVQDAAGRHWFVTHGVLDDHIRLAAHAQRRDITVIDLIRDGDASHRQRIAKRLPDARSRMLVRTGFRALVEDWILRRPDLMRDSAFVGAQHLLMSHEGPLRPAITVMLPESEPTSSSEAENLLSAHEAFWQSAPTDEPKTTDHLILTALAQIRRQTSIIANNLGVQLAHMNRPDLAWEAFGEAQRIDADNLSALLNRHALIEQGFVARNAEAHAAELQAFIQIPERDRSPWRMAARFGEIRSVQAYMHCGAGLVLTHRVRHGVVLLQRALTLARESYPDLALTLTRALAGARRTQGQLDDARVLYEQVLEHVPHDRVSLLELAELERADGNNERALQLLDLALDAGAPLDTQLRKAEWHLAAGALNKAGQLALDAYDRDRDNPSATAMLLRIAMRREDPTEIRRLTRRLQDDGDLFRIQLVHTEHALSQRDWSAARRALDSIQRPSGFQQRVLAQRLELDIRLRDTHALTTQARFIRDSAPHSASGNLAMGILHLLLEEWEAAEQALRISADMEPSAITLALLAHVLSRDAARSQEALAIANQTVSRHSQDAEAWLALAAAANAADDSRTAEEALQRARALEPEHPSIADPVLRFQR